MNFLFKILIIWFTLCTIGSTNEIKVFEFTEMELITKQKVQAGF